MINNGAFDSSLVLTYQIQAERPGSYTIPAIHFKADGRDIYSQPVSLKVEPQSSNAHSGRSNPARAGWVELWTPKETAYVGEVLPLEVRLYIDGSIARGVDDLQMPSIAGDGFTAAKLAQPTQTQVERNGRSCVLLTFRTVITPSKAGSISIGPATVEFMAPAPRAAPARRNSPFDDFFGDNFFNDPGGVFARREPRKVISEPLELTVKPLPAQGRPANFSGAVGKFSISEEGSPSKVKIGDPITMKVKISGTGSFERVTAPQIADAAGWRSYPATSSFRSDDASGYRGEKTFEQAVIPEVKKNAMPVYDFSYFDPSAEKYVTESTKGLALETEGEPAPATPPPAPAQPQQHASQPQPQAPPTQITDIHGIAYDLGQRLSFEPLYRTPGFLFAQLARPDCL